MNEQPKSAVAEDSKRAREMNNRAILPVHWIRHPGSGIAFDRDGTSQIRSIRRTLFAVSGYRVRHHHP